MTASDFVHPTSFFLRAGGHPHMTRGGAAGDGPILWDGVEAMPASGHRHLGSLAAPNREDIAGRRIGFSYPPSAGLLRRRPQHDPLGNLAGGRQPPQLDEQLAGQCDNHGLADGAAGRVALPTGLTRGARGNCPPAPGPSPAGEPRSRPASPAAAGPGPQRSRRSRSPHTGSGTGVPCTRLTVKVTMPAGASLRGGPVDKQARARSGDQRGKCDEAR